jgi:CRP/FNR family cyclic AMP-dependent transcriptional regulator
MGGLEVTPDPGAGRFASFFAYPGGGGADDGMVFLGDRTEDDWTRLLAHAETLHFRAGDVVVRAGEEDRALFVVAEGTLEALLPGRSVGALIGARSVFGEVAFLDGQPRSATVRAVTDGALLRLSFDAFEVLAARYGELGRAILLDLGKILARRLRHADAVRAVS